MYISVFILFGGIGWEIIYIYIYLPTEYIPV